MTISKLQQHMCELEAKLHHQIVTHRHQQSTSVLEARLQVHCIITHLALYSIKESPMKLCTIGLCNYVACGTHVLQLATLHETFVHKIALFCVNCARLCIYNLQVKLRTSVNI